ncbi:kinase-like protein [Ceratobasidium sp. AG-I]|nr:kinase-like protein [Ceratobasidium sp. AG-I]
MSAQEIIAILGRHGCLDVTGDIDLAQCSSRPVAGGGFGDIYRGSLKGGSQVAMKCPRLYLTANDDNRNVLKAAAREIYTWSKCKHAHVLELIGLASFRGHVAMVSSWMAHKSLSNYLTQQPDVDRCELCTQITSGLAYLHGINVVHGDVKGANVVVSANGVAKLTDFGNTILKTYTLRFTGTNDACSFSLRWTAPEILGGTTAHTRQSDVYALGMTILEVISGEAPFQGKPDPVVYGAVLFRKEIPDRPEGAIPVWSRSGDFLWQLLTLCWAYNPKTRPGALHVLNQLKNVTKEGLAKRMEYDHSRILPGSTVAPSTAFSYVTTRSHLTPSPSHGMESNLMDDNVLTSSHIETKGASFSHKPLFKPGMYVIINVKTGYRVVLCNGVSSPVLSLSDKTDDSGEWLISDWSILNRKHSLYAACWSYEDEAPVYGYGEDGKWSICRTQGNKYRIKTTITPIDGRPLYWGVINTKIGASIVLRREANDTATEWLFQLVPPRT